VSQLVWIETNALGGNGELGAILLVSVEELALGFADLQLA
jgi:hypothetical protein